MSAFPTLWFLSLILVFRHGLTEQAGWQASNYGSPHLSQPVLRLQLCSATPGFPPSILSKHRAKPSAILSSNHSVPPSLVFKVPMFTVTHQDNPRYFPALQIPGLIPSAKSLSPGKVTRSGAPSLGPSCSLPLSTRAHWNS